MSIQGTYSIPELTMGGLLRYRDDRIPTGGFLHSVLCNDLKGAIGRADAENARALQDIVRWCYWELPANAWGSPEEVSEWLSQREYA